MHHVLRYAIVGAGLGALLSVAGCGRRDVSDRPGALLLIVIDTLRADRLGAAGYEFAVTPTLDSLAAAGVRFEDASTPVPVTLPAVTSLLTGLYPPHHGVRDNGTFALDPSFPTLAGRFRAAGYRTGAVVGSAVLAADRGLSRGFEIYDAEFGPPYPVYDETLRPYADEFATNRRRADRVTDRAAELVRRFADDPFFVLVHYFDVHMAYDPPPKFAALHPRRPYDGEVSFVDAEIGRLLAALGDREDVLVVVVADHGESQGEHGEPQHGFLLYQPTLHVPFLVSGPGVPSGVVREDAVDLVDVAPTLATVFRLGEPAADGDGVAIDWVEAETGLRDRYAETMRPLLSYGWSELRALRRGPRKLIRGGGRTELYDLATDPSESRDLRERDGGRELAGALDEWTWGDDPADIERAAQGSAEAQPQRLLESLGYLSGPGDASPGPKPHPLDELPRWTARQDAKQLLRRAAILLAGGDFAAADSLAALAQDNAPAPAEVLAFRGYVAEQRRDTASARRRYEEALAVDPDQGQAHRGLARLADAAGDFPEALRHWRHITGVDSTDVDALRYVSLALLDGPDPASALPYLRMLVRIDSTDATSRYNLALAAAAAGRAEEARHHFEETLRLSPDDPEGNSIRFWLESGRWPEGDTR